MSEGARKERWTRRRWLTTVSVILACQLILIFALSDRGMPAERTARPAPPLRFAGGQLAAVLVFSDPTFFALPHRYGFSGEAWLSPNQAKEDAFAWTEEPHWLDLPAAQLGDSFRLFMTTNVFQPSQPVLTAAPRRATAVLPFQGAEPHSRVTIEGPLEERQLSEPIALKSWPGTELLTNTVVQLLVAADGRPLSATILRSSGQPEVDQYALEQAKAARFSSLRNESDSRQSQADRVNYGRMIFKWEIIPAMTNHPE